MPTDPYSNPWGDYGNDYTTPSYTAPKNQTTKESGSNWLDWARLAYGVYKDNQDPKFKNVPLSPEQRQLFNYYFASLNNPNLKDNAAKVSSMGHDILGGYSNMKWQSPTTFSGQQGYAGTSTAYRPPATAPIKPNNLGGGGMVPTPEQTQGLPYRIGGGLQSGVAGGGGSGIQHKTEVNIGGGDGEDWHGRSLYDWMSGGGGSPTEYANIFGDGTPNRNPMNDNTLEYDPNGANMRQKFEEWYPGIKKLIDTLGPTGASAYLGVPIGTIVLLAKGGVAAVRWFINKFGGGAQGGNTQSGGSVGYDPIGGGK